MSGGLQLLDASLMRRLDQMSIAAKSRISGTMQGKRRSRNYGSSLDFADYRLYSPGDDTRQLDWNAYGRTGKPFIKLFMDEQELHIHLWLDASKSMDFGRAGFADGLSGHPFAGSAASSSRGLTTRRAAPQHAPGEARVGKGSGASPLTKWEYARTLAAAIGYVSLNRYDRVSAAAFTDRVTGQLKHLRGKGSAARLFEFLAGCEAQGAGDAGAVFCNPAVLPRQAGMTWLFSDFLYENGVLEALQYLLAAKQEVVVVQVLSPEELNPGLSGELRLIDSESGAAKEVAVSSKVLQSYREAVEAYTQSLRSFCFERGITYLLAATDVPPGDFLLGELRRSGLVR